MEAIILAGGFGTRLRPLTYTRAKALLPILNKPMITYLIDALPSQVDKVILAVNYKKDQIEDYFSEHDCGKEIVVNDEPTPLGTGGAVKFAQQHITDDFFVVNADNICSLNFSNMMQFHMKKKSVATISLWPVENVSEFGVVDICDDGNVVGFVEKPKQEDAPSNLINAGAYLLNPLFFEYIETGRLVSMEKEIFPQIIKETGKFYGYEFTGFWTDVGRVKSYLDIHQLLLKKQGKTNVIGKKCTIKGTLTLSSVGDHVSIGTDTTIKSSVVLPHATIGKQVTVDNCVIGEDCTIEDGCRLHHVVVGDNETIAAKSTFDNKAVWDQPIPDGYPKKQIGNVIGET